MEKHIYIKELHEILNGREQRQALRLKLSESGNSSVSLNLNIPGFPKNTNYYLSFFEAVSLELKNWLTANQYHIQDEFRLENEAGVFLLFEICGSEIDAHKLKLTTEIFEENHILARFIDVDVCDNRANLISSGKLKKCFYCGEFSAIDCMKNQRHSIEILRDFQQSKITNYLQQKQKVELSHKISALALRSVLYEICLTPKPGLVDFNGSGIHKDMDFNLFMDSTSVISGYFESLFRRGYEFSGEDFSLALPQIRFIGLQMEKAMFLKTKGVNSQKGIIFLMGISLFCVGFSYKKNEKYIEIDFINSIKSICKNLVKNEFKVNTRENKTHGEKCFEKYGIAGVRQEAEEGLPTIFQYSLPLLKKENNLDQISLTKTLLILMAKLYDTNILYRSNMSILLDLQSLSANTLHNFSKQNYQKLLDFCLENKLSPGGAADLLSITIFLYLLEKEDKNLPDLN